MNLIPCGFRPGKWERNRKVTSQTWFGCGCYFVGNYNEKYCNKHAKTKPDYYKVFGDQIGVKECVSRLSKRLIEKLRKK